MLKCVFKDHNQIQNITIHLVKNVLQMMNKNLLTLNLILNIHKKKKILKSDLLSLDIILIYLVIKWI